MVFSSLTFLFFFLPVNLLLYYLVRGRTAKNTVLIVASLVFYAWGEPVWVILLIFSATIDYFHGRIVEHYRGKWQSKAAVMSSVVVNLGLLGIFKFSGFFVSNINFLLNTTFSVPKFALPIGISFYTFQTISYVIDVYRNEVPAQRSYWKFLMFVSLFHQLVAGPIVRYKDIANEIENRVFKLEVFSNGINRFIIGLGKKVFFANTAGELASTFLAGDQTSILGSWFGIFLYAMQIYFDFSGYSDMAIGLGKMFGFTYKENFNYPYFARTATDFWRRWHISLGSFFRDYVYIPLGGNRKHQIPNLLAVWFLTGLWHGPSWNYVVWGLFYGVLIILEKILGKILPFKQPAFFGHIYLPVVALIGWVFFYFEDLNTGLGYLSSMFGLNSLPLYDFTFTTSLVNNCYFVAFALLMSLPVIPAYKEYLKRNLSPLMPVLQGLRGYLVPVFNIIVLAVAAVLLVGQSYNPFLYFRF